MKIEDNNKFKKILFSLTRFCERLDLNVSELYQVLLLFNLKFLIYLLIKKNNFLILKK